MHVGRTEFVILAGRVKGNLLKSGAAVLVVPADTGFVMRGSLARQVRAKGGPQIATQLRQSKPLLPGEVVMTGAGQLPAHKIYHAVVSSWTKTRKARAAAPLVLQATIWQVVSRCVELAQLTREPSLAFPSLGTGSGQADPSETHATMTAACLDALRPDSSLQQVLFCFNSPQTADIFSRVFLQRRIIQQTHGLVVHGEREQAELSANLERLWPLMSNLAVKVDKLVALVETLDARPTVEEANYYIGNIVNSAGVAIGPHSQANVQVLKVPQ
jgi:O-acetyl-ADP-ribose deacetylase (regulator of RNase III)